MYDDYAVVPTKFAGFLFAYRLNVISVKFALGILLAAEGNSISICICDQPLKLVKVKIQLNNSQYRAKMDWNAIIAPVRRRDGQTY